MRSVSRPNALSRAEKLDREIESRRGEMFGDLEKQRDDLTAAVGALRDFEAAYRANLTSHLRKQIETLESGRAEPVEVPDVVRDQRPAELQLKRDGLSPTRKLIGQTF